MDYLTKALKDKDAARLTALRMEAIKKQMQGTGNGADWRDVERGRY